MLAALTGCSGGASEVQESSIQVPVETVERVASAQPAQTERAPELEDVLWIYRSGLDVAPVEGFLPTLQFHQRPNGDLVAAGNDGCNGFGARIRIESAEIIWDEEGFFREDAGCEDPIMQVGAAYLSSLARVTSFERRGDVLHLRGEAVELELDAAANIDEALLVDDYWLLDDIIIRGERRDVVGRSGFVHFDGRLFSASTGCRSLTGTWARPAGNYVTFPNLSADGPCGPELRDQDRVVIGVLGDGFSIEELTAARLRISSRGDQVLVFRRAEPGSVPPQPTMQDQFGFVVAEGVWSVPEDVGELVFVYATTSIGSSVVAEAGPGERMVGVSVDVVTLDGVDWRQVQTDALVTGWIQAEFLSEDVREG